MTAHPSQARVARRHLAQENPEVQALLREFFGMLHALYWSHWTSHWQVDGNPFYGDHLLFERLYKGVVDEIDTLAEKMVARYGPSVVSPADHFPITQAWIDKWSVQDDPYHRAFLAESDFQDAVKKVYDNIKAAASMSLGLDDYLMSIANDHETHMYLLQQRLGTKGSLNKTASPGLSKLDGNGSPDMSAEGHFFDKPKARETREFAESGAISNSPNVVQNAIKEESVASPPRTMKKQLAETPPTVTEILQDTPGSADFSTLSRYVVETAQTDEPGVPQGHHEVDKHPDLVLTRRVARRWLDSGR